MTSTQRHRPHDPTEHDHVHGDGCCHRAVSHDDHVDYLHNGHWHAPDAGHYDEHPNLDQYRPSLPRPRAAGFRARRDGPD
jgi:hypothetical protein